MNKLCRRSLRRGALCPFVVRLSRTFFRFVTFFQNVVKSVKLFSAAGNALIGLCFPPCQALFETFAKFLLQTWFPGTDRLCMPINVCSPSCKGRACQIFVGTYRGLGYPVVCVRQPLSGGARSVSTLVHPACQQKSAPFSKFFSQGPNLSSWGQTNRPDKQALRHSCRAFSTRLCPSKKPCPLYDRAEFFHTPAASGTRPLFHVPETLQPLWLHVFLFLHPCVQSVPLRIP